MALRAFVFALFGLLVGSFLTVVVHRVPRKESIVTGRSRCPACGATVTARDNLPVVSWLLLRGRCRSCGARISARYPLTEVATGALAAGAALEFRDLFVAVLFAAFFAALLALALIDAELHVLPNRILYPAVPAFAVAIAAGDLAGRGVDVATAGLGLLAYGGGLLVIALISPRGMAMGDVKLAAFIGLVLGALGLRYVAVAAALGVLAGGIGGVVALLAGRSRKSGLPYGPFLAAGAVASAFLAPQISSAYLGLFR
jgi:leader peptidase (prepilin peptidase) / N-methyltransferase